MSEPTAPSGLAAIAERVDWADGVTGGRVREALETRTELGRLVELAAWVATVATGAVAFGQVRGVVFGADALSPATADLAMEGTTLQSVAPDLSADTELAVSAGAARVDAEVDRGADLLLAAYAGDPLTTAVTVAVMANAEPVKVLARGVRATEPQAWMVLAVQVRDERRRCMEFRDNPDRLLAAAGNADLAAVAGFLLQAAARRTPVIVDGPGAVAAALVAYEAQPRAVRWWYAADSATDPGHELALSRLGLPAVLGMGTSLGDGTAALLAVPVLRAAGRVAASVPPAPAVERAQAQEPDPDASAG